MTSSIPGFFDKAALRDELVEKVNKGLAGTIANRKYIEKMQELGRDHIWRCELPVPGLAYRNKADVLALARGVLYLYTNEWR